MDALELAILFHHTYERLAPNVGYDTRVETRIFDPESPNGKLMVAVCAEILPLLKAEPAPTTQVPVAWHKMARVWIGGDVFEDRWVACSEDSAGAEPLYAQSTQSAKEKK